jgi:hypothetical protein
MLADGVCSQTPWAREHRLAEILSIILSYGAEAQRLHPHLRETVDIFDRGKQNFPRVLSKQKSIAVRKAIEEIEAAKDRCYLKRVE